MPLTFPTQAEQCLAAWQGQGSLQRFALRRGAQVMREDTYLSYTFDDDSWIKAQGVGRNYVATTELP